MTIPGISGNVVFVTTTPASTSSTSDIRITAWSFGRRAGSLTKAYRLLEAQDATAEAVFSALERDEWGVKAAFRDGLDGVNIEATHGVTTHVWTGGTPYPEAAFAVRRRIVAANGGTV